MPELPEVETIRRQLAPRVTGHRIVAACAHDSPKFTPARAAVGARIEQVARRGKYLLFSLDDRRELITHLGMTGSLRLAAAGDSVDPYVRARWQLDDDATLEFRDIRRFGRIAVVRAGDYSTLPTLARQGPEPFDPAFDATTLWRELRRSRSRVKTQLLSQRPVAGVGNIYADEALWHARIHPARRSITKAEASRLVDALREALRQGLDNGGTTLRDYRTFDGTSGSNQHALACYGRHGQPCHRCGGLLVRQVIDARGTTLCRTCQPR